MRRIVILIAAIAVTSMTAPAALAKGPESATLSGPDIDEPIELVNQARQDPGPTEMLRLSGLWYGPGTEPVSTPPESLGIPYVLTWVSMAPSGDSLQQKSLVFEQRAIVQYLYLDADGGPLIHTPDQVGLDGWGGDVIGWFEAAEDLRPAVEEIISQAGSSEKAEASPAEETPPAEPAWLLPALALEAVVGLVLWGAFQPS